MAFRGMNFKFGTLPSWEISRALPLKAPFHVPLRRVVRANPYIPPQIYQRTEHSAEQFAIPTAPFPGYAEFRRRSGPDHADRVAGSSDDGAGDKRASARWKSSQMEI